MATLAAQAQYGEPKPAHDLGASIERLLMQTAGARASIDEWAQVGQLTPGKELCIDWTLSSFFGQFS